MKNHIIELTVETKKNTTFDVKFLVVARFDGPFITGSNASFSRWQGTSFGFGASADEVTPDYYISLLRNDLPIDELDFSTRHSHAGFQGSGDFGKTKLPPNPGTIVYRNVDIGEMSACYKHHDYIAWRSLAGSKSVYTWVHENIDPGVIAYIREHKSALRKQAVAHWYSNGRIALKEARSRLKLLEEELTKNHKHMKGLV